ncbi:rifin [Plasmodium falciparum IGH-CR14]|uniref:Rifin n=1 Tax=Plasmodium falciparum IGH-CR14 TaxID=580059 RepID=A0A0L1I577_PLAFA|nr:rifin [Plasmodium falciparum IGH-CR14]
MDPEYNTAHMKNTEPIKSYRSLCECELYTSMYDDDPEMKEILHDFDRQTSQRFEEYNERMNKNRQKCKEQCDRDIKNIILKDKIAKELKQELTTLETNIGTNDIPTCVCDKSVADKVEKTCLKCGGVLGGAVPELGLLCSYGAYELVQAAIAAGIASAKKEAIQVGIAEGIRVAIQGLKTKLYIPTLDGQLLSVLINAKNFKNPDFFSGPIILDYIEMKASGIDKSGSVLSFIDLAAKDKEGRAMQIISATSSDIARSAEQAAERVTTETTKVLTAEKTGEVTSISAIFSNPMVISFIVVVIIVIILLIIYLILRYRRKKKMKRKLQYIKLFE